MVFLQPVTMQQEKYFWGAFQYQMISLPKMSFGLVQSGWGESECFNKKTSHLAPARFSKISSGFIEVHPRLLM